MTFYFGEIFFIVELCASGCFLLRRAGVQENKKKNKDKVKKKIAEYDYQGKWKYFFKIQRCHNRR